MLRRYRNAFLQRILAAGLDPALFESDDNIDEREHPGFEIRLKGANLLFVARNPEGDFEAFDYWFTRFGAGFPYSPTHPDNGYTTIGPTLDAFDSWLSNHVLPYLEDQSLPDLWSQAESSQTLLSRIGSSDKDYFTEDEKQLLRAAMSTFRVLVDNNFSPTPQESASLDQQLQYLGDAVDRLNRFDWKGTALNTLIGITLTLSLDVERGRQLFGLFQQAFAYALHLLK